MRPRLSLVTLGVVVADVACSRRFYETLGFKASSASVEGTTFFEAGGVVIGLFGRAVAPRTRMWPTACLDSRESASPNAVATMSKSSCAG